MSIHGKGRADAEDRPIPALLRRRIVFELTPDQLPLLEAAEGRHGSKRGAIIAALRAEAEIDGLRQALARAERAAEAAPTVPKPKRDPAAAKQRRELEQVTAKLREREDELRSLRRELRSANDALGEERVAYDGLAEQHERNIADLEERAVDHLFCARCGAWVPPSEWAWTRAEDGHYAHHDGCGDHGPGLMGASSWLAFRAP
jgi:hypothetical protein